MGNNDKTGLTFDNMIKEFLRSLRLRHTTGDLNLTIHKLRFNPLGYLSPRIGFMRKVLKKYDCVLVGSRAYGCYKINGITCLGHKPNDWDVVMTEKEFMRFTSEENGKLRSLGEVKAGNIVYFTGINYFMKFPGDYNEITFGKHIMNIFIEDSLPSYKEINDGEIKVCEFMGLVNNTCLVKGIDNTHTKYLSKKFNYHLIFRD